MISWPKNYYYYYNYYYLEVLLFIIYYYLLFSWYQAVSITASSGITESSLRRAVDVLYQTKTIDNNEYDD
jgi:hypothetical protein